MTEFIQTLFTNKQLFTYIIMSLYVSNFLFQVFVTRDYVWGGYWFSAACITLCAMTLSQRGGA